MEAETGLPINPALQQKPSSDIITPLLPLYSCSPQVHATSEAVTVHSLISANSATPKSATTTGRHHVLGGRGQNRPPQHWYVVFNPLKLTHQPQDKLSEAKEPRTHLRANNSEYSLNAYIKQTNCFILSQTLN